MSKRNVAAYARWYFPDIKINFANAGEILGKANLDEMIRTVTIDVERIIAGINELKLTIIMPCKAHPVVKLKADEIKALISAKQVALDNHLALIDLMTEQKELAKKEKTVLPECRNIKNHFETGDDIMIYIGSIRKRGSHEIIAKHDWVPAKMLSSGNAGMSYACCHSNEPFAKDGSNGGHYFAVRDQDHVFKRKDFYDLRGMIKRGSDLNFLELLPKQTRDSISKDTVYPMSDEQLAKEQKKIIKTAYDVVDKMTSFHDDVITMAKRFGVKLKK